MIVGVAINQGGCNALNNIRVHLLRETDAPVQTVAKSPICGRLTVMVGAGPFRSAATRR